MDRTKRYTDLDNGDAQWVRMNIHELENLPDPQTEWQFRDVDIDKSTLISLRSKGLVERLDREVNTRRYTYRTNQDTFKAVQHFAEKAAQSDGLLPCGHSAFLNQGGILECKRCDGSFDKSEVSA